MNRSLRPTVCSSDYDHSRPSTGTFICQQDTSNKKHSMLLEETSKSFKACRLNRYNLLYAIRIDVIMITAGYRVFS